MTATKFLCIDDQQDPSVDYLLGNLQRTGRITFTRRTPVGLELQLPIISSFAADAQDEAIGLLLDLRLDVDPDDDGLRVAYRGPTLAQEIRTRMAEGELASFPIVLWSVNRKFRQSYFGDETSHDLFDEVFGKDEEILNEPENVALKLASLASGYVSLRTITEHNALSCLGLPEASSAPIYFVFASEFLEVVKSKAKHEVAHLILRELIAVQGLLITEQMLASRLGVDIAASGDAWSLLKVALEGSEYVGPFHEGWPRWWWYRVEDWWALNNDGRVDLRRLSAVERVERLNSVLGSALVPAEPIEPTYSTKYSTLCVATLRPLDPIDGFRITQRSVRRWHDAAYVSALAALERTNKAAWQLDALERDRFDQLKQARSEEQ
ncbi:MAG: hypothetical protein EWV40_06725 [Microcystis flos-aquae Mf_WU_F_19750830_S460]|uniref:Uncharacterized protein n=1 Tax=Microcystis flos-aquae Mf_WU_F_19750830_S460 TaxID=2486237 RepID=A0A552LW11_9CHRO|nr:MAG: hypothetical protein EWV40_06725 [Microcystis flos-aquae Mf_WU_F_19750830_S460]